MGQLHTTLDEVMTDLGMNVGPEELTYLQALNLSEIIDLRILDLKEEVQLADTKQLIESTLPAIMQYCVGSIELGELREELHKAALAADMPGQEDEGPPEPMDVQKFMCDYALWVGHTSTQKFVGTELTPRAYMEQFVEAAWLPSRDEMYAFLEQYTADKVGVYAWIDENFEWE